MDVAVRALTVDPSQWYIHPWRVDGTHHAKPRSTSSILRLFLPLEPSQEPHGDMNSSYLERFVIVSFLVEYTLVAAGLPAAEVTKLLLPCCHRHARVVTN